MLNPPSPASAVTYERTRNVLAILDSLIAEYEFQGEVVGARNAVANLVDTLSRIDFVKAGPVVTLSIEDFADMAISLAAVKGSL